MFRYYLLYKPFQVLSQYTDADGKPGLNTVCRLPKKVYPVGRLDYDSEGLLLLTSNPAVNHLLLNPAHHHQRTYYAQVEGTITDEALMQLAQGVDISVDGKTHRTLPAIAQRLEPAPALPSRVPTIRFRATVPDSWLSLTLTEGKNRQVRKMTAAVGFPTLRLVRYSIEDISLGNLQPGQLLEMPEKTFLKKLRLS